MTQSTDRVALVTGNQDAIGAAIAARLAADGFRLVLCDAYWRADAVARGMSATGNVAEAIDVDCTSAVSLGTCIRTASLRYGRIDVLVNNPGSLLGKTLDELSEQNLDYSFETLVRTTFNFMKAVVPIMKAAGYGRIVNLGSLEYLGWPRKVNVAAAHAAVFGLPRSVALEVAGDNITVNSVIQGDVDSSQKNDSDREKAISAIPVRRLGTAADVANAVAFFASEGARYVTGQTLFVCGGKSVHFSMSV